MAGHLFTPEALQQVIAKLPPIDPAKPHTLIGTVDSNGVQVAVAMKFDQAWTVQGVFQHEWNGDNTIGAKVIGSW